MKVLTKSFFILLIIGCVSNSLFAQAENIEKATNQFFTAYTTNSIPAWKIALGQLENATDDASQLFLAKGYYGAASTGMGNKDEDFVVEMLDKSEATVNNILAKNKKDPEANALRSFIYGLRIALSPIKSMYLGPKSGSAATKGVKLAPDNGFTNFVKGNNLFYTPAMFGGDVEEGIIYLEKSKSIYEKAGQTQSWEYMNVLTLLGQAYHSEEQFDKAKETYTAALVVAPNFGYIKMYLLPQTEKAAKSK